MGEYADRVERGGVRSQPWEVAYLRYVRSSKASDIGIHNTTIPTDPDFDYLLGAVQVSDALYETIETPEIVRMADRSYGYQQGERFSIRVRAGGTAYGDFVGSSASKMVASGAGANQQPYPVDCILVAGSSMQANGTHFTCQYVRVAGLSILFVILRRRKHGLGPRAVLVAENEI